jgi:hypothetical protein
MVERLSMKFRVYLIALLALAVPSLAHAQCGVGAALTRVPFTCAKGNAPALTDPILGGQSNRTVQFTVNQLIAVDHSSSPVTASTKGNTLSLGNIADYLSGVPIPSPIIFGSTVTLSADPTAALQPATKQYVDNHVSSGGFTGGTVTDPTIFQGAGTGVNVTNNAVVGGRVTTSTLTVGAGATITGNVGITSGTLTLTGGSSNLSVGGALTVAGAITASGAVNLAADPTSNLQAATKQYVDTHTGSATFTGGTVVNPTTFNGSGTGMTVANNAQINGVLNVGTGTANAAIKQASTGPVWAFTLGSPTSEARFLDSTAATTLFSINNNQILIGKPIRIGDGAWGSGLYSASLPAPIFQNSAITGTTSTGSAGGSAMAIFAQQTDTSATPTGSETSAIYEHLIVGAGGTGLKLAGFFVLDINTTADTVPLEYVGLTGKCNMNASNGATVGYETCFAINSVASVGPNVHANQLVGNEGDTWAQAGSIIFDKIGMQLVDIWTTAGDMVQGTSDDVALSINNQHAPSTTIGYRETLEFGRDGGNFPGSTTGNMIGARGNGGTPFTTGSFVNMIRGTFSTAAMIFPGYSLYGGGAVQIGNGVISPVAAGMSIDVSGRTASAGVVHSGGGGTNYRVGDYFTFMGGLGYGHVTGVSSGAATTIAIDVFPQVKSAGAIPANPVATETPSKANRWPGTDYASGMTLDLTWPTTNTSLILNPTGGPTGFGGQLAVTKISDPGIAPGAGLVQITAAAGTNAGTCKIVLRAGTSSTPVTLIDNIGSGC